MGLNLRMKYVRHREPGRILLYKKNFKGYTIPCHIILYYTFDTRGTRAWKNAPVSMGNENSFLKETSNVNSWLGHIK